MLTPVEMQGKELKQGRGYQKKEVDEFLTEVYRDYEELYRQNVELKDKVRTLSEGLNYYKDLEKTLQKTLIVAEKTAEETTAVAKKKATVIMENAQNKANAIVGQANTYYDKAQGNISTLMQQYESYRIQCKKMADAYLELLNSDAFVVNFEAAGKTLPIFQQPVFSNLDVDIDEDTKEQKKTSMEASNPDGSSRSDSETAAETKTASKTKTAAENETDTNAETTSNATEGEVSNNRMNKEFDKTAKAEKAEKATTNTHEDEGLDTDIFEFFNLTDDDE